MIVDCSLFAVAFATSLCIDEDTTEVMYDQQSMRQYRRDCLVAGELVSIPECAPRRCQSKRPPEKDLIPIQCICRLPDDGSTIIKFTHFDDW